MVWSAGLILIVEGWIGIIEGFGKHRYRLLEPFYKICRTKRKRNETKDTKGRSQIISYVNSENFKVSENQKSTKNLKREQNTSKMKQGIRHAANGLS